MTNFIKNFAADESGAVTVDWVVLTAALVGLGLAVMAVVSGGVEDLSGDIDTQLTGMGISTDFGATVVQTGDVAAAAAAAAAEAAAADPNG